VADERSGNEAVDSVEPQPARGWGRTFQSLQYPVYRQLWIGSFLSFAAMQMTIVARPWLAFEISGSGVALGLVAAAQGLPMLLFSPFGGVAADRLPKKLVLLVSQASLLMTGVTMTLVVFFDVVEVWHLVVVALIHGTSVPFNQPVRQAYIPLLLPRTSLPNGVALQGMARNLNQVLAPSIGGVLLTIDPVLAFTAIVVLHTVSMLVSMGLPMAMPIEAKSRGVGGEALFGLRYMLGNPVLRTLVGLSLLSIFLAHPYQQLLPVFGTDVLKVSPFQLGMMYTAMGSGALASSLIVASFSSLITKGYPLLIAGLVFGVALVGFALSPYYWLSIPLLVLTGAASQSYAVINQTLMMMSSDPALYGRVASVQMMMRGFMPLVVLPAGFLVDEYGAPTTVATGGVAFAGAILLLGTLRPALWQTRTT
jgi:MFS family permease